MSLEIWVSVKPWLLKRSITRCAVELGFGSEELDDEQNGVIRDLGVSE